MGPLIASTHPQLERYSYYMTRQRKVKQATEQKEENSFSSFRKPGSFVLPISWTSSTCYHHLDRA